jgi:hypothetical protein
MWGLKPRLVYLPHLASPGHASVDPPLKRVYLFLEPRSVAWHRSGTKPGDDSLTVLADVFVGPKIEGKKHGTAIPFPKQGFDVSFERPASFHWISGHGGLLSRWLVADYCDPVIFGVSASVAHQSND